MLRGDVDVDKAPHESEEKTKKDFKLTPEEVKKFEHAFEKKEFRDMFMEYVNEINDPEIRKKHEQEIAQLELERGNKVRWVRPDPRFCLKTQRLGAVPGNLSGQVVQVNCNIAYVNIAASTEIERATATTQTKGTQIGLAWSLPHSLTPPRLDTVDDDSKKIGIVFDVIFHPETVANPLLKKSIIESAFDSIENKFSTKLQRENFEQLKDSKYHGTPVSTAIREPAKSQEAADEKKASSSTAAQPDGMTDIVSSSASEKREFLADLSRRGSQHIPAPIMEPKYAIVYQYAFDMGNHMQRDLVEAHYGARAKHPAALLVRIELPRVKRVSEVELRVETREVFINVPEMYHGVINLPYLIDRDLTSAKWFPEKGQLEVTLPLLPQQPATRRGSLEPEIEVLPTPQE